MNDEIKTNTDQESSAEKELKNKIDVIIDNIKSGKKIKVTRGEKTYILLDTFDQTEMRWKVESESGSIGSIGMSVYNIDSVYDSLESEDQKDLKKEAKQPKQPKEPKAPKAPKAPNEPKAKPAYEFIRELTTENIDEIKTKLVEAGYVKPVSEDYIKKQIKNRVK